MRANKVSLMLLSALILASPSIAAKDDQVPIRANYHQISDNWLPPLIGGVVAGIIISELANSDNKHSDRYNHPYDYSHNYEYTHSAPLEHYDSYEYRRRYGDFTHYCVTSQNVDQFGRIYYTRKCQ